LEMKMVSRRVSRVAYPGDQISLLDALPFFDKIFIVVGVGGEVIIAVTDQNQISISGKRIGVDDLSCRTGIDGGSVFSTNVYAVMRTAVPHAETRTHFSIDRPQKKAMDDLSMASAILLRRDLSAILALRRLFSIDLTLTAEDVGEIGT